MKGWNTPLDQLGNLPICQIPVQMLSLQSLPGSPSRDIQEAGTEQTNAQLRGSVWLVLGTETRKVANAGKQQARVREGKRDWQSHGGILFSTGIRKQLKKITLGADVGVDWGGQCDLIGFLKRPLLLPFRVQTSGR